jgi:hypothetical protein
MFVAFFKSLIFLFFAHLSIGFNLNLSQNCRSYKNHQSKLLATEIYDAQVPTEATLGLLTTTAILGIAGAIWWNDVIPQKRNEVAISKRKGDIKDMLDEIRDAEPSSKRFERWFFNDWLNPSRKDAAIPFIKKVKWNSGDNPILVAFAGIFAFVLAASLAERIF